MESTITVATVYLSYTTFSRPSVVCNVVVP